MKRLLPVLLLLAPAAHAEDDRPARPLADKGLAVRINRAIDKGIAYLERVQKKDGHWEFATGRRDGIADVDGGLTALALYALAASGVGAEKDCIRKGVRWTAQHKRPFGTQSSLGTYSASLLVLALTRVDDKKHRTRIHRLAELIVRSQLRSDMWTYQLRGQYAKRGRRPDVAAGGDNSNSQFAILALWAAYSLTEYEVPKRTWERIRDLYATSQLEDGGWSYSHFGAGRPARGGGPGSPSMTAAGLVAYVYALAALDGRERALRAARQSDVAQRGRNALLRGPQNYLHYYYAYALERAGTVMNIPLGRWYVPGAKALVDAQKTDGSWHSHSGMHADPNHVYSTSLALLFLSHTTLPPRRAAITKRERIPNLAEPDQLERGFDYYLDSRPEQRARFLREFGKAGPAAVGLFIRRLRDRRELVRVAADELLEKLVDKRFFFEPTWPERDREVMLGPIEEFWTAYRDRLRWDGQSGRFVISR